MAFRLIDVENWERKEVYTHFMEEAVCSYAVNVELDITALKGQKLYPAMLWLLTDTVNEFPQFRTHLSPEGVGIFDDMTPSYTIFNEERKSFSSVWTPFDPDYQTFLRRYLADVEQYKTSPHYRPKPGAPENCFDVSMAVLYRLSPESIWVGKVPASHFYHGEVRGAGGAAASPAGRSGPPRRLRRLSCGEVCGAIAGENLPVLMAL